MIKWNWIYKQMQELLDKPGDSYYSGSKFIRAIQEFTPALPDPQQYLEDRRRQGKSTTRRNFFEDILNDLDEGTRIRAVSTLLEDLGRVTSNAEAVSAIKSHLGTGTTGPTASVPAEAWNSDRLNTYLNEIDEVIQEGEYARAVTLSYTCLEGFLGSFLRSRVAMKEYPNEIIELSKQVRNYLKASIQNYPDEVLNLINLTGHAVDKARNRFSEAHFGGEAGRWLAVYVRDIVNSEIRLLLHFM